jgi:hypothetical protein
LVQGVGFIVHCSGFGDYGLGCAVVEGSWFRVGFGELRAVT